MPKKSIAVMVLLETDDKRLDPERLDVSTAAKAAAIRKAVIDNLPHLTRVVMVLPEETAKLMSAAHNIAAREAGFHPQRPPFDYVPPSRQ
jgi:hypothetical protein